jgi:hypothetical protein
MTDPTRRHFIAAATALPVAAGAAHATEATSDTIASDLAAYIGFGTKRAGGAGDNACGHWLADQLARAGYAIEKPAISVPHFDAGACDIVVGDIRAALMPQPIVTPTAAGGVTGPLVRVDAQGRADAPLAGAIALVDLPYGRWSSALARRGCPRGGRQGGGDRHQRTDGQDHRAQCRWPRADVRGSGRSARACRRRTFLGGSDAP